MTTAQERKRQERQARRRRIQQAARTVFAEKGYGKTSIEQIARQASLSVGAIYLYFRSKEDLYISLLEETLEAFDNQLKAICQSGEASAAARLQSAWSYLTDWAISDVEGTRILRLISQSGVRRQLSEEVAKAAGEGIAQIRAHLVDLIEAGVRAGQYQTADANQSADLLWALFLGLLQANDTRSNLDLEGPSFADSARNTFQAVEFGLQAGTSHPAPQHSHMAVDNNASQQPVIVGAA